MLRRVSRRNVVAASIAIALVAAALLWRRGPPPSAPAVSAAPSAAPPALAEVPATVPPSVEAPAASNVDIGRELVKLQFAWDHDLTADGRDRVLDRAVRLGGPEIVRWLAQLAMTDPSSASRAAGALAKISDRRAADPLLRLVRSDASPLVRAQAAHALGASGERRHAGALAELLGDRAQPLRLREECAFALGRIGDADVVPALIRALDAAATAEDAADTESLRIAIARVLGRIANEDAREALRRHGGRDLSEPERAAVAEALHPH